MKTSSSSSSSIHSIIVVVVVVVGSGLHAAHDGVQRKQAAVPEGLRAHHQPRHGRVRAGEAEQQHPSQEDQVSAEHHSGALLKLTLMQQLLFLLRNLLCFVSELYLWLHLLDIDYHCILLLFLEKTYVRTYASFSQCLCLLCVVCLCCCAGRRVAVRSRLGSSSSRCAPASPALSSGPRLNLGAGSRCPRLRPRTTPRQSLSWTTSREVRKSPQHTQTAQHSLIMSKH